MTTANNDIYDLALRRHLWLKWLIAALIAGMVNGGLFLLLPGLIFSNGEDAELMEVLPTINVIRLKRKELPPKKKKTPPKPEEKKPQEKPHPLQQKVVIQKLSLPFKLSPEMPNAPAALHFTPVQKGSFSLSGIVNGVDETQLDSPLIPINKMPPPYPMRAQRRNLEGFVRVRFLVDEQGMVSSIEIVESKPAKIFDRTVLNTVSKWRFKPGTVEGVPVKVMLEVPVRFGMEK